MATLDPSQQWQQFTENYRRMSDDELCRVARDASSLVSMAREVLQAEIAARGLKVPPANGSSAEMDEIDEGEKVDPRYLETPDELEMVDIRKVYTQEEAEMVKSILEANFVASCLGPDEVVDLKGFKGNFASGVDFKVLRRDSRRAELILNELAPVPETEEEKEADGKEYAISCPKCHSGDIIFEGGDPGETAEVITGKFYWTCADCGHEWKDDGIAEVI